MMKSPAGCPFGDRNHTCLSIELSECSNPEFHEMCCHRCQGGGGDPSRYHSEVPSPVQKSLQSIGRSYCNCFASILHNPLSSVGIKSCFFFFLINMAVPCPLGDLHEWCPTYIEQIWHCYSSEDTCCQTCLQYRTNITGQ